MNELTATQKTILEAAIGHLNGSIHPLPEHIKGGAAKKVIQNMLKNGLIEKDGVETWRITEAGFLAIGLMPPQIDANHDADFEADVAFAEHAITATDDPELAEDLAIVEQAMEEMANAATEGDATTEHAQAAEGDTTDDSQGPTELEAITAIANAYGVTSEFFIRAFEDAIERAFKQGQNSVAKKSKAPREPGAPKTPRADSKQAKVIDLMRRPEGATLAQIAEVTGWQGHTIRSFISTSKKKGLEITTNHVREGISGSITTYFA